MFMLIPDAEEPAESSSGFAYATPERGLGPGIGSVIRIFEYQALVSSPLDQSCMFLTVAAFRTHCADPLAHAQVLTWSYVPLP